MMTDKRKESGASSPNIHSHNALYTPGLSDAIRDFQDRVYNRLATRLDTVNTSGELVRFRIGRKGLDGWYVFYSSPVFSAAYGSWKTGLNSTWTFKTDKPLSHAEKQELARLMAETKAKREAEKQRRHKEAEKCALSIWCRARPVSFNHPYIMAKKMGGAGLRQLKDSLVIPLYQGGKITSLQFIDQKGNKKFLTGGKITGSAFIIGNFTKPFDVAYICEGVSTGFSIHVLSDYKNIFCAMNAGNLQAVAVAVRAKWSDVKIIIAADNDVPKKAGGINIGVMKAQEAAKACGGEVSIPTMPDGSKCDWCDVRLLAMGVKS